MRTFSALTIAVAMGLFSIVSAHAAGFSNIVVSSQENATESEPTIAKDTPKIFMSADLDDVSAGSKVTVSWISVDSGGAAPPNYKIDAVDINITDGINQVTSNLSEPTAGWPVGTYRVDLAVDGNVLGSANFAVK